MSETRRLLDPKSGATLAERELLEHGLDLEPPPGARAEVWEHLAASLALPVAAGLAGEGAAWKVRLLARLWRSVAVKILGGTAIVGAVTAATVWRSHAAQVPQAPEVASLAPTAIPATPPEEAASAQREPEAPDVVEIQKPRAKPPHRAAPSLRAPSAPASSAPRVGAPAAAEAPPMAAVLRDNALTDQSRQIAAARSLLRSGRPADAALALLAFQSEYPSGELAPEASLLLIESLEKAGRPDDALRQARRFLADFPAHPLASVAADAVHRLSGF